MSTQIAPSAAQVSEQQSNAFLRRLTAATGGGMFLDGYVFAAIAAVIAGGQFTRDLHLSAFDLGLIGSATLIGTVVGGPVIGYLTDIFGRKPMFLVDICAFLIASLLMLGVTAVWQVVVLGIILGMAIGGDYAIGSPLLGQGGSQEREFVPVPPEGTRIRNRKAAHPA